MTTTEEPVVEAPNVLHGVADRNSSYSSINLSEAIPGVTTPLGWSLWGPASNGSARAPWYALGATPRSGLIPPEDPAQLVTNIFFGRVASRMNYYCEMGDLIPGSTGDALARDAFGYVPPNFVSHRSRRRYPVVMFKMPLSFFRVPVQVIRARAETDAWWRSEIRKTPDLNRAGAAAQLLDAKHRFDLNLMNASNIIVCGIQPVFTHMMGLAGEAGVDPTNLMRGHGSHEETAMIEDLWLVSRDQLSLDGFLLRHGYHGPAVGEVSRRSWREDPEPLNAVIDGYRSMDASSNPVLMAEQRASERKIAERELLAALPRKRRAKARVVLRYASRNLPLRAVSKVAFVQNIDVARAAARRSGTLLAAAGVLADPEDIFYLTAAEIAGPVPPDARGLVEGRRALRERYLTLELPATWDGLPRPAPITEVLADAGETITGTGVSAGVVEGVVRVVKDPADTAMELGEILIAHTTDPSWASVMFMASALVVDIGGQLSHAAVVARELGLPCVMNTRISTRVLRNGDRCRVDGAAGTIEILERAL